MTIAIGDVEWCEFSGSLVPTDDPFNYFQYSGPAMFMGYTAGNGLVFVLLGEVSWPFLYMGNGWFSTDDGEQFSCQMHVEYASRTQPPVSDEGRALFSALKGDELAVRVYSPKRVWHVSSGSLLDDLLA